MGCLLECIDRTPVRFDTILWNTACPLPCHSCIGVLRFARGWREEESQRLIVGWTWHNLEKKKEKIESDFQPHKTLVFYEVENPIQPHKTLVFSFKLLTMHQILQTIMINLYISDVTDL